MSIKKTTATVKRLTAVSGSHLFQSTAPLGGQEVSKAPTDKWGPYKKLLHSPNPDSLFWSWLAPELKGCGRILFKFDGLTQGRSHDVKYSLVHLRHKWSSISPLAGQTVPKGGRDRSQLTLCEGKTSVPKSIGITGKISIEFMGLDCLSALETNSNKEQ